MLIFYGISENRIDITEKCLELSINNIISIPDYDLQRSAIFGDPLYEIEKKIFVIINLVEYEFDINCSIKIDVVNLTVTSQKNALGKLKELQNRLRINHGDFNNEVPEQKMAITYLNGNEKVLEIGGNIGRNSLIIASIVKDLVTLESDSHISSQLEENRNINGMTFHIENSALSKRKLIQKGWDTKPSDILEPGYNWVNTITLEELNAKYNIVFDTLVLDCEGAFYYILMDMPEILNNIKLIIMENDYTDISHKNFVDSVLIKNGFQVDYQEKGGWGCCYDNFFEVWKLNI